MARHLENNSGSGLTDDSSLFDYFQRADVDIEKDITITAILPKGKIIYQK